MNFSDLHGEGTLVRSIKEQLSQLTWHDAAVFANESILRTSLWLKSGSIARDAYLAGVLEGEPSSDVVKRFASPRDAASVPFSQSEDFWAGVATKLGLPPAVPRSVDSILKVERQRREIIPMTIWDDKIVENCSTLMAQHGISRPGAFAPALFVGPTGASKTHSVIALYPALGIPVNVIEGTPALTSDVRIELITGGSRNKAKNFESYVSELASMGYFQTQTARLAYYQNLAQTSERTGCDLIDAHARIEDTAWNKIARLDGYPVGEPSFQVYYPGRIRLGQIADQVNLVDEVNKFSIENQQDLRNHLSSEGVRTGFNTVFAFTANPASDEYQGRSALGADILGCCHRQIIAPRSPQQYSEYIRTQLGVHADDSPISAEVLKLISENNPRSADRSTPTDVSAFQTRDHVPLLGRVLPRNTITDLADRVSQVQTAFEGESAPGRKLHPATYGVQMDASKPSVRSISALLKRANDLTFMAALQKGKADSPDRCLTGPELAGIFTEVIEERYVAPYIYESDAATQLLNPDQIAALAAGNDPSGNSSYIRAQIALAKLNQEDLETLFADVRPQGVLGDREYRFMEHNFGVSPEQADSLMEVVRCRIQEAAALVPPNLRVFLDKDGKTSLISAETVSASLDEVDSKLLQRHAGSDAVIISEADLHKAVKSGALASNIDERNQTIWLARLSDDRIGSVGFLSNGKPTQSAMKISDYVIANRKSISATGKPYCFDSDKQGPAKTPRIITKIAIEDTLSPALTDALNTIRSYSFPDTAKPPANGPDAPDHATPASSIAAPSASKGGKSDLSKIASDFAEAHPQLL